MTDNNNNNYNNNVPALQQFQQQPMPNTLNNSSKQYPFRIVTHNIQGFNDTTKRKFVLDFMQAAHIDIMGLSETKLTQSNARYFNK